MSKIANAISMLQLLSNHRKYTIKELSERLEVSERMIRVYRDELEKAGIYIDTIHGPYGGYILSDNVLLPRRGFSKYDILLLKDIHFYLDANPKFKMQKEYELLVNKITETYHSSKQKGNDLLGDANYKDKYNLLSKAIKNHLKVAINFTSLTNINDRVIHPCNLFLYNNEFYVSAFCELRGEMRHFALSRINNINLLSETF